MIAKIETVHIDGRAVVRPRGELDLAAAPDLRAAGLAALHDHGPRITLDMRAVDLIDSVILGIILGLDRRCRTADGDLQLIHVHPRVVRLFALTRTEDLLNITPAVD
jgi:anti-sigma B factor antagonist